MLCRETRDRERESIKSVGKMKELIQRGSTDNPESGFKLSIV